MDSKQKQPAVIEFLMKERCGVSDIHRRPQNAYGDDTNEKSNALPSVDVIDVNILFPSVDAGQSTPPPQQELNDGILFGKKKKSY